MYQIMPQRSGRVSTILYNFEFQWSILIIFYFVNINVTHEHTKSVSVRDYQLKIINLFKIHSF